MLITEPKLPQRVTEKETDAHPRGLDAVTRSLKLKP